MKPMLPYIPTPEEKVEKILEWADVKPGQKSLDLGSGDGRIVIAMAKAGAIAYGFEILEKYVRRAKAKIATEGLREKAFVSNKDFWQENLSSYDIITFYGMAAIMNRLSEKLTNEVTPGTIVISNGFSIPRWKILKEEDFLYFYKV